MAIRPLQRQAGGLTFLLAPLLLAAASIAAPLRASAAQPELPPLADSSNGVHSFIDINMNGPLTPEYLRSIAWRFDYGFSAGSKALAAGNPHYVSGAYRSATQFGYEGTGLPRNCTPDQMLKWLKANHPDWILYQTDKETPLQEYDYKAFILDLTNPEYVDFKWKNDILPVARATAVAIALDNATLSNDFMPIGPGKPYGHAVGVYDKPGHWVQKFAGKGSYADVTDPAFTRAMIDYLAELKKRLHAMSPPKLLTINTDPKIVFNDKQLRAKLIASVDAIMIQGGALGPDSAGDPRKIWLNNIHFIEDMNAAGKGVYSEQVEAGSKSEAGISKPYIRFVLASYLLAKGRHCAIRLQSASDAGVGDVESGIYWPAEFDAAHSGKGVAGSKGIGTPLRAMSQAAGNKGSENGLFIREYTGGVSLVNASRKDSYTAKLPEGSYKDLDGKAVASPLTVPPRTGLVLLKTK